MTGKAKTHLLIKRGLVACQRNADDVYTTTHPASVTCGRCLRTIHMADAEARAARQTRKEYP